MNKFLEFFKGLFELSDEQLEKASLELNNTQKSDTDCSKAVPIKETTTKETKTAESTATATNIVDSTEKTLSNVDLKIDSSSISTKEVDKMEELKALQEELKAVKEILESTQAERVLEKRSTKINSIKNCIDYSVLSSLLDGVEEKDIENKVEEIKKDKGYLFQSKDTEGFNPATPQNTVTGVESAFYDLNPTLK